jgi:hypothetical protein
MSRVLLVALLCMGLTACPGTAIESAAKRYAEGLTDSILDHDDPQTVRDALPAYLLALDGAVASAPDNVPVVAAAARIYALYASSFAGHPERQKRLADRSKRYALQALSHGLDDLHDVVGESLEDYVDELEDVDEEDFGLLYAFATAWTVWLQANVEDWNAIADLPKIEATLRHIVTAVPDYDDGNPHMMLGVLTAQIPPSLGGKPEVAQTYFQNAIKLSDNKNLQAKVYYAQYYARLVFDQELHDRLLREALKADPKAHGFTLSNILAQDQAVDLLVGSQDYF